MPRAAYRTKLEAGRAALEEARCHGDGTARNPPISTPSGGGLCGRLMLRQNTGSKVGSGLELIDIHAARRFSRKETMDKSLNATATILPYLFGAFPG